MLQRFLGWLGFGLCHQLPERSYFGGGLQAPVCARDTGIYVGMVLGYLLLVAIQRTRPRVFPPLHVWLTMGFWLAFMAWDGLTSYGGLRTTVNELRLITGLGVGFSAAVMVYPMINDTLWRTGGNDAVLTPAWRFWVWLCAIPVAWALITFLGPSLGVIFVLVIAFSVPASLVLINLVIISMLPWFDRRAVRLRDVALPLAIAAALAMAEIALAAQLRAALLGAASGA